MYIQGCPIASLYVTSERVNKKKELHSSHMAASGRPPKKQGLNNIRPLIELVVESHLRPKLLQSKLTQYSWHVVFSFGTVVSIVLPQDLDSSWTYTIELHREDYPFHRFRLDSHATSQLDENLEEYNRTLEVHPEQRDIIRTAYRFLIKAGYPFPGNEGSDTITYRMGSMPIKSLKEPRTNYYDGSEDRLGDTAYLWGVSFPNLSADTILTFVDIDANDEATADTIGRDYRRYDFLIPRIAALISGTNLKVTYFE